MNLFGLDVDAMTLVDAREQVLEWASSAETRLVVTPNVDHFMRWVRDPHFRALYELSSLRTIDSSVLRLLLMILHGSTPDRVTGVDLFNEVVLQSSRRGMKVALIGGRPEITQQASMQLKRSYPKLVLTLVESPAQIELTDPAWLEGLRSRLRREGPQVVALCLGSPKQEQLYADLLDSAQPLGGGVFLCVGAAIDFAAGTMPRAPYIFQRLGLEWLFRLTREPRRLWQRYMVDDIAILYYFRLAVLRRLRRLRHRGGINEQ